jgi:glycosyltransferase involved in cell wall biosynthesis
MPLEQDQSPASVEAHAMRVLLVSQHFWPESFRINDVASALQQAGCEVTVLTGQPNYPGGVVFEGYRANGTGMERHKGLEICRVPLVPRARGNALRLVTNYLSFIATAATLGAWQLRHRRFDVVFVYATSPILQVIAAVWLARLKGCAVVTWVQDLWPDSLEATGYLRNPRALATVSRLVRWIYARCDLLLVQSQAFVSPVRALAGKTTVRYHPNSGDESSDEQGSVAANAEALTLAAGFNVVFSGNLGTVQGLETVLDAAELLLDVPDARFVLVGSGQRSAWLAEEIARRRLTNVQLTGRFPPERMPAILAQASALLVSLANSPAMLLTVPSKVQSYLAAGRPIIAALDGEGARIVLEAGAGVACPAADAPALASAVRQLHACTPAMRSAMGTAGRAYYERHFALRPLTQALLQHLRWAAAEHRSHTATMRG